MTVPLDQGDKKILLISGCLLAALTVILLLVPDARQVSSPGYPSSYSAAKDGAKAAYTLLGELGYRVERWTQTPGDLLPLSGDTVLIVAGPTVPASPEEERQLRAFVAEGGRLLVTRMLSAEMVGANGVGIAPGNGDDWAIFAAERPAPLTMGAPEITMESSVRMLDPLGDEQRYYGDSEGATVTKFRIGKGTVVWWAGDSPLTNFGVSRASNLALFLNSVGPPGRTRVLWDEYFHGVRLGLWHYLGRTPLPWALLQLVVLVIFVLLTYARRSGAMRPVTRESRLSPLEFVTTLGGLYEHRGEAAGALEIAYSHFRFLLTRRLGIPSTVATADLVRRVQAKPAWAVPGFAQTIEQIDSALKLQSVTEAKALAWIGELYDFAARFGLVY
jgi:hypothetical protein